MDGLTASAAERLSPSRWVCNCVLGWDCLSADLCYVSASPQHRRTDAHSHTTHVVWHADWLVGDVYTARTPSPFLHRQALDAGASIWGSGFTSEGIDQNPALYDFILGQNWRAAPVDSISDYLVTRAHRRYGLTAEDSDVTKAWTLLQGSMYSQDVSVADFTGVKNLPGGANWVSVCEIYDACARARARVCENVCACVKMCVRVLLN